jgi:hypothetical protein
MQTFNDLHYLDDFIVREIERNWNVSFSGLFKRHRMKVSLIGDYPILKHILNVAWEKKHKRFTSNQIYNGLSYSKEYKELKKGEKVLWKKEMVGVGD